MSEGFAVTEVTVSVSIADRRYGDGNVRFASLKAESRDPQEGIPLTDLTKATIMVLDLLEQADLAAQTTRYAQGDLLAKDLNEVVRKSGLRFDKIRKMLRNKEEE